MQAVRTMCFSDASSNLLLILIFVGDSVRNASWGYRGKTWQRLVSVSDSD